MMGSGQRCCRGVVDELAVLVNGVVDGKWTMIRVALFLIVVLAESPDIRDGPAIRLLIRDRLTACKGGNIKSLVHSTKMWMEAFMGAKRGGMNAAELAKVFHSLVIRHKIRAAVQFISERYKVQVYMPHGIDEKSGENVIDFLRGKHQNQRPFGVVDIPDYGPVEDMDDCLGITVDNDIVDKVARNLSGSGGPGGGGFDPDEADDPQLRWKQRAAAESDGDADNGDGERASEVESH